MPWGRTFRRLLNLPSRSAQAIARDVDDELHFHMEMRVAELTRLGMPTDAAERQARREFGDLERARRTLREENRQSDRAGRRGAWLDELQQDLRFSWRQLARNPGFTIVAVVTLGVGIGANTAIFSAVRGILLRPLSFQAPDRLYRVMSEFKGRRSAVSVPDFVDFRAGTRAFEGLAAYYDGTANLTGDGPPERLESARVTSNFFKLLRVRPLLGRLYADGEDDVGAPRYAVLSEGLWRRRFGADPKIIGRRLLLDGLPSEVIGVIPHDSRFPFEAELWLPTQFTEADGSKSRGARWLRVLGRLSPGATVEAAQAELAAVAARLAIADPKHNTGYSTLTIGLQESIVGDLRTPLLVLLGAVGLVMLVSCANVAGLLLGRTMARDTEMAVRTALGAGRSRIARQLITESVLLSLLGAAVGFALASQGTRVLASLAPADTPRLDGVRLDLPMLGFTVGVALLTGLLFGLVPALRASSGKVQMRLREGSRGAGGRSGRARVRRALVVGEVAMAIVLLVGAGLLLRSFAALRDVDPGFVVANNTAFTVTLPGASYASLEQQRAFELAMRSRLQQIPGVRSAVSAIGLPMTDTHFSLSFTVQGRPEPPANEEPSAQIRIASLDYFETMGIRLKRGRVFGADDRANAPPVVVATEELVRRYFPNEDPIGKVVTTGWKRDDHALGGTIVGVVANVRQFGLASEPVPVLYVPSDQWPVDEVTFVVSSTASAASLAAPIRGAVAAIDPNLPIFDYHAMADLVDGSLAQPRFYLSLLGGFSSVALLLAAIGLYGVIAYAVQQRTREIGVRMALGASSSDVLRMVIREGLGMSALGVGIGLAGAFALTRLLQSLLFGVKATDPLTYAAVAVVLTIVAVGASAVPARRASTIDPQRALRAD